jgi:hypothetical protein
MTARLAIPRLVTSNGSGVLRGLDLALVAERHVVMKLLSDRI